MSPFNKLTTKEEAYMRVLWQLKHAFIREIIEELPEPKPHYNTVSTTIKILEEKGFVGHEELGNSYRYYPRISKEAYMSKEIGHLVSNYFDNSVFDLVTYFAKKERISEEELTQIMDMINKSENQ